MSTQNTHTKTPDGLVGSGALFGLRASSDRLHQAIAVMLKDWREGDFALPRLAEIHMAAIEEKYREVGKALRAADDGPHFVIVGYNGNSTPCAALTVYAASAGIEVVRANAVLMMHDAGHDYVKRADVIGWPNIPDEPRAKRVGSGGLVQPPIS